MGEFAWASLMVVSGLGTLVVGGELLVRGASGLATIVNISPLIIGLTVVAFGTSAPELVVSLRAGLDGNAEIALGNVVGSNIFNVLFILGLSAVITPLVVSSELIRRDVAVMIVATVSMLVLSLDGSLSRVDGALLSLGLLIYIYWCVKHVIRSSGNNDEVSMRKVSPEERKAWSIFMKVILCAVGLLFLGIGSSWLVDGAVIVATLLGVSSLVIGLTIVAVGTSLPEVVTSVLAALRGERDIAVGNVIGSNIFNILCVMGFSSLIASQGIAVPTTALRFDIPIMIAVAVACLPIFFSGNLIARWEGAIFLFYYFGYVWYLLLEATSSEYSRTLGELMIFFMLPLTVLTLAISVYRTVSSRKIKNS